MTEYRRIPSIERLIAALPAPLTAPHAVCVAQARQLVATWRQHPAQMPANFADMVQQLNQAVVQVTQPSLRRVINATGVLLQTNLGRAPLSDAARTALNEVAASATIEYELESGQRGDRHRHVTTVLRQLTGAQAALAVNNNAAAILLTLAALTSGREVIVSRSQAVEIGGGFRIPDVLKQSGAKLVEVGTTNRTYVRDYADAITPQTAAILCVHHSNFRILGFTHEPTVAELAELAHAQQILLIDNVGSGSLLDVTPFGLQEEPLIQTRIRAGADVICFSGDKLIGGPQAGIIVGRTDALQTIARHPLMRAVRPDKLTIAALHATLLSYVNETALTDIPIWRMIATPVAHLAMRANTIVAQLPAPWQVRETQSTIGGGALPGETLPSWALVCPHATPDLLASRFRHYQVPIIGRVQSDAFWLDMRTIAPSDDMLVRDAITQICAQPSS